MFTCTRPRDPTRRKGLPPHASKSEHLAMNPFLKPHTNSGQSRWASNKQSLPLYKDKPSASKSAFSPARGSRSKRVMLFRVFVSTLALYIFYYFVTSDKLALLFQSSSASSWAEAKKEVRDVFLESWAAYEADAWGKDVYHPVKGSGENMGPKPLGWMVVDLLDTLLIMECQEEFNRAKRWVKEDLLYDFDYNVNVFETTIRMLGGLLSAYHLSNDDVFVDKAAKLANSLIGGFNSPTGIPYSSVNLKTGEGIKNHVDNGASSTAEAATLQLEFRYLAKLTGEDLYWKAAEKIMEVLDKNQPKDGLVPIFVQPDTGKYQGNLIRLGSRGDSYYEYLLKQHLQTNNKEPIYWQMYKESVDGVKKHLVGKSKPNGLTFIGELEKGIGGPLSPKMDHLVCFYGGLLALGATNGLPLKEAKKSPYWSQDKADDMKLAEELTYSCYKMYKDVETGLSPEIVVFNTDPLKDEDFTIKPADRHNLQRPETVESLYYLYQITGDEKYREWGYEIFQSFQKYTRVLTADNKISYTSLNDVTTTKPSYRDNMESFWLAETLKYLYLLFDDENKLPLNKYVFNTEAHPFPRFDMAPLFSTGWSRPIDDPRNEHLYEKCVGTADETEKRPEPKIDKKNPPQAAPAAKKVDEEMKEEVKKDPLLKDDEGKKQRKVEEALKDLQS